MLKLNVIKLVKLELPKENRRSVMDRLSWYFLFKGRCLVHADCHVQTEKTREYWMIYRRPGFLAVVSRQGLSERYSIKSCAVKSSFKTGLQISLSRDQSYRLPYTKKTSYQRQLLSELNLRKLDRRHTGRLRKRDKLLTGEGRGGLGEEPNNKTTRKPGPLWITQYSPEKTLPSNYR